MFTRTPDGVYRSSVLSALEGVEHGFGSRQCPHWPGEYTHLKQIHSDTVVRVFTPYGCAGSGDALITDEPGRFIGIRTADCVPILLANPSNRAVAAVHAGWRGTAARIAAVALDKLAADFGSRPAGVFVAIGPSIGPCCFEVGPEVANVFGRTGRTTIDLVEENRRQLMDAGVPAANIDVSGACTMCDAVEFHSWRRDRKAAGRMVAAIRVR
jgi:YfiH family protein